MAEQFKSSSIGTEMTTDKKKVVLKSYGRNTAYGVINTVNRGVYEWTIKLTKFSPSGWFESWFIGIDSSEKAYRNGDFTTSENKNNWYAIQCYSTTTYHLDHKTPDKAIEYGAGPKQGDISKLVYDANNGSLNFFINGTDQGMAFDNIDTTKSYNLAVSMYEENDEFELQDFKHYGDDDIDDKKEQYSVVDDLKKENQNLKQEIMNKMKEITNLQNVLKIEQNHSKQTQQIIADKDKQIIQMIQVKEEQLQQIVTLKDELEATNKKLIEISEKNEEEEKKEKEDDSEASLKTKLLKLSENMSDIGNEYNKNKLSEICKESVHLLLIEDEINKTKESLKLFTKKLNDIEMNIISLTRPDPLKYKSWDINMMITWIGCLENGKYKQYCDTFKNGFKSDGITFGESLPEITKNDLRNEPFKITDFNHRTGLAKHFASLLNQQESMNIAAYSMNNNNVNEGTSTDYI